MTLRWPVNPHDAVKRGSDEVYRPIWQHMLDPKARDASKR